MLYTLLRFLDSPPCAMASFFRHALTLAVLLRGEASLHSKPESSRPDLTMERYFDQLAEGPGLWKWRHYFEAYEMQLRRFRNCDGCTLVEIGIYSGGSMRMWRWWLGEKANIIGIDLSNSTLVYDGNPEYGSPRIFAGDQGSKAFWQAFHEQVPSYDILIDDGGHAPQLQLPTLLAAWPHLAPGGVYVCEDLHGALEAAFARHAQTVFNMFIHSTCGINWARECRRPKQPHHRAAKHLDGVATFCEQDNPGGIRPPSQWIRSVIFTPYLLFLELRTEPLLCTTSAK